MLKICFSICPYTGELKGLWQPKEQVVADHARAQSKNPFNFLRRRKRKNTAFVIPRGAAGASS
jgi:hypothetical protein